MSCRVDHLHPARRLIAGVTALAFSLSLLCPVGAGAAPGQLLGLPMLGLPAPGAMVLKTRAFTPALIRGVRIDPNDPLKFNFLIDIGDSGLTGLGLKDEANRMIKYFLAALTVPEDQIWVNLSPYEEGRVVGESLGRTEMGRDLLAQDYLLKQLSASLLSPDEPTGKDYWQRVYQRAQDLFGTTNVPVDTFNKIWIVPQEAVVYEDERGAYVGRSHLKVMLEADYLALEANLEGVGPAVTDDARAAAKETAQVTADVVREVLLPEIEREVNEGETFATLRQMYHAMILATWYKTALKESLLGRVYADQNKIRGVDLEDPSERQAIYDQYLEAFRVGVYDAIKEDLDPVTNQVLPRRYFSGGFGGTLSSAVRIEPISSSDAARDLASSPLISTETMILEVGQSAASGHTALQGAAEEWAAAVADISGSSPVGEDRAAWAERIKGLAPENYQTDKRGLTADNERIALALHYVMRSLAVDPFHLDASDRQEEYLDFFDRISTRLLRFVLKGARLEQDTAVIFSLLYPKQQQFVQYLETVRDMTRERVLAFIISLSLSPEEFEELRRFAGFPEERSLSPSEIESFVRVKFAPPEKAVPESPTEIPERLSVEEMSALLVGLPEQRGLQLEDLSSVGRAFIMGSNAIPTVLGKDDVSVEEVLDVFDRLTTRVLHLLNWGANLANLETILPYLNDQQRQVLDEASRDTHTPIASLLGQFLFDSLPEEQRVAFLENISFPGEGGNPRSSLSLSEFIREQGRPEDFRPLSTEAFSQHPSLAPEDAPPAGRGLSYADMDLGAWGRVNFYFAGSEKPQYVPLQERLDFLDRLSTHVGHLVLSGIDLEPAQGIMAQLSDEQLDFIAFLKEGHPAYAEDTSYSGVLADLLFLTLPDRYQNLMRVRPGAYHSAQVDSVVRVLRAHPDILRPSRPRSERPSWADLARERGGGYLTGLRGLTLEGMPALPEDRRGVVDPVAFVEKFFREDPAFEDPAGGPRYYLEFLDQLSTRLMQFVLDGASLRQDAERVLGMLSDKQKDFVGYIERVINKDAAQSLALVIRLSLNKDEALIRTKVIGDHSQVEELEDLVRMVYGRGGLDHLPSRTMIEVTLARLPATREMDYERLSPDTKTLVDNVIPLVYEMGPDSREEALAVVGALSARVFALLGWGADLAMGELDWMTSFLEDKQQLVLKKAAEVYDMDPATLLADIVLDGMSADQRTEYLKRIPRGVASFGSLREFVADLDRPEQVSSPARAERGETPVVARLDAEDAWAAVDRIFNGKVASHLKRQRVNRLVLELSGLGLDDPVSGSNHPKRFFTNGGQQLNFQDEEVWAEVERLLGVPDHVLRPVVIPAQPSLGGPFIAPVLSEDAAARETESILTGPYNFFFQANYEPFQQAAIRSEIRRIVRALSGLGSRDTLVLSYGQIRKDELIREGSESLALDGQALRSFKFFLDLKVMAPGFKQQVEAEQRAAAEEKKRAEEQRPVQLFFTPVSPSEALRAAQRIMRGEHHALILEGIAPEDHGRVQEILRDLILNLSVLGQEDPLPDYVATKSDFTKGNASIDASDPAVARALNGYLGEKLLGVKFLRHKSVAGAPDILLIPEEEDRATVILAGITDAEADKEVRRIIHALEGFPGYLMTLEQRRGALKRFVLELSALAPEEEVSGTGRLKRFFTKDRDRVAVDDQEVLDELVRLFGSTSDTSKTGGVEMDTLTPVVIPDLPESSLSAVEAREQAEEIFQQENFAAQYSPAEQPIVKKELARIIQALSGLGLEDDLVLEYGQVKKFDFFREGRLAVENPLVIGKLRALMDQKIRLMRDQARHRPASGSTTAQEQNVRVLLATITEQQAASEVRRIMAEANLSGNEDLKKNLGVLKRFVLELSALSPEDIVSGTGRPKKFFTKATWRVDLRDASVVKKIAALFWTAGDTLTPVVIPLVTDIVPLTNAAEARAEAERILAGRLGHLLTDGYSPEQRVENKKELAWLVLLLSRLRQHEILVTSYGQVRKEALTNGKQGVDDDDPVAMMTLRRLIAAKFNQLAVMQKSHGIRIRLSPDERAALVRKSAADGRLAASFDDLAPGFRAVLNLIPSLPGLPGDARAVDTLEILARKKADLTGVVLGMARDTLDILRDTDLTLDRDASAILAQVVDQPERDEWLTPGGPYRIRAGLIARMREIRSNGKPLYASDEQALAAIALNSLAPRYRDQIERAVRDGADSAAAQLKQFARVQPVSSPLRILVVDDSRNMREMMKGHLEEDMPGAVVVTAESGEAALAAIQAATDQPFDLIITDRQMGEGMDGVDLANAAGAAGFSGPIFLMSARLGREAKMEMQRLGVFQGIYLKNDLRTMIAAVKGLFPIKGEQGIAPVSSPGTDNQVGGIDLNAGLLDLQIKRDGHGVPLPLPQQPIADMHIEGFIPVILNMTPVPSLPLLLGLATGADDEGNTGAGARTGDDAPMDSRARWMSREPEELSLAR